MPAQDASQQRTAEVAELYGKVAWLTILVWICYPVVWLFSTGFASFSVSFEVRASVRRAARASHARRASARRCRCGHHHCNIIARRQRTLAMAERELVDAAACTACEVEAA